MLLNFLHSVQVSEHNKKLIDWRQLIADRAPPDVLDRIRRPSKPAWTANRSYLEGAEAPLRVDGGAIQPRLGQSNRSSDFRL